MLATDEPVVTAIMARARKDRGEAMIDISFKLFFLELETKF